jgi:predicted CDP-diglyceride synthetase/phosphatidate cytidylyltransferase
MNDMRLEMNFNNIKGYILSGIVGGIIFVTFLSFMGSENFIWSLLIGLAGYVGGTMIFASKKKYDL